MSFSVVSLLPQCLLLLNLGPHSFKPVYKSVNLATHIRMPRSSSTCQLPVTPIDKFCLCFWPCIIFFAISVIQCQENSHYELCGTECGHTCASNMDPSCDHTCTEGCFCDEGFFRSGSHCIPLEQCGCQYDGFYFEVSLLYVDFLLWIWVDM